jgi:hypothetical protein
MTRRTILTLATLVALAVGLAAAPAATPQTTATDTVLAAGDIAPATDQHNAADYATSEEVLRQRLLDPDATVLALGDTQYERGAPEAYESQLGYTGSWGRFLARTCPVAGNHEYLTPDAAGFFGYFADRLQACAQTGRPDQGYYAFNLPASGWRVYVLNSQCSPPAPSCAAGSPQVTWLQQDLAANASRNILAAVHHPRFGSRCPFGDARTDQFVRALNHVKAELFLAGHEHCYVRFGPLTWDGRLSSTGQGIRHFTIGTGGRSLICWPAGTVARPGTRYRDCGHYGIVRFTLTPDAWASAFVRTDGQIVDSVSAGVWR